jgi:hypothetical protein
VCAFDDFWQVISTRRWREVRLAAGLALVAAAVILGWQITKGLSDRDMAWVAVNDLPAGLVLRDVDVTERQVLLGESADAYYVNAQAPIGEVIGQPLRKGELIPRRQAESLEAEVPRLVTVGVQVEHAPLKVKRGDLVDVWVFIEDKATVELVLSEVIVDGFDDENASFGDFAAKKMSLLVDFDSSKKLVEAGRAGVFDIVLHGSTANLVSGANS